MEKAPVGAQVKVVLGGRGPGVDDALARCRRTGVLAANLTKAASRAARSQRLTKVTRMAYCMQKPGLDA
eukprot:1742774-Alexandrium_andersonii.AAC.1